jgi:hypothetical protein
VREGCLDFAGGEQLGSGMHTLVSHPAFPPKTVRGISVEVSNDGDGLYFLRFIVDQADDMVFRNSVKNGRQDGLWKSTCFELFIARQAEAAYEEFNFAPYRGWAAYRFDAYRRGMRPLELPRPPQITDCREDGRVAAFPGRYELDVSLDLKGLNFDRMKVGLSAVVQEQGGTKSYWALRHPPGPPDFHHPDCFALTLPAPD